MAVNNIARKFAVIRIKIIFGSIVISTIIILKRDIDPNLLDRASISKIHFKVKRINNILSDDLSDELSTNLWAT